MASSLPRKSCAYCGKPFQPRRGIQTCCSAECGRRRGGDMTKKKGDPEPCHVCGAPGVQKMCKVWWCGDCLNRDDPEYERMVRERALGCSPMGLLPEHAPPPVVMTTKERQRLTGL